jgi:septal ring factor EnvC (AmiA/AmiB activator)
MAEDQLKKHLPEWAKRTLLIISIVGPLTGVVVTTVSAYYDIRAKARDARLKTEAGYETLAPAVKELQDLLNKTQDFIDAQNREIAALKADRDEKEKRILRLEAYIDVLGRRGNLPAPPPEVAPTPSATVSKVQVKLKAQRPVLLDVGGAQHYQQAKAELQCAPNDPSCEFRAAAQAQAKN